MPPCRCGSSSSATVTIHDTSDPAVIVAEYELAGTVTTTNSPASARFAVILTVNQQGRITRWREYQDHHAIAEALQPHGSSS